jgi:hypothetical protein
MTLKVASSREIARWNEAARKFEELAATVARIRQRLNYSQIIADFAASQGITVRQSDPAWWDRATSQLEQIDRVRYNVGLCMDSAESGELAIQSTPEGDLNIVAPESLASKWAPYKVASSTLPEYQTLGVAPLIVLGVVVVAIIAGVVTVNTLGAAYANKIDKDLAIANRQAEIHFCTDPNSATCLAWQAREKKTDVKETKSAIDWLLGKGAGKSIGAGIGVAIGVGLLLWAFRAKGTSK